MTMEFGVRELEAQPIVGIRTTVAMSEIGNAMGPLFGELSEHIAQSGQEPAGMPLARYHSPPGETVELECAIPVASPMPGGGSSPTRRASRREGRDRHPSRPVRRPPPDMDGADGVDGVPGARSRGLALGGLCERPRRRARPVEVANRHLLPGALTGAVCGLAGVRGRAIQTRRH